MTSSRYIKSGGVALVLALGLLMSPVVRASDANAQNFNPSIDTSKYFSIYGSQTMQKWQWGAGSYFNYAWRPVEFGVSGTRIAPIVEHLIMADFWGTIGLTDWVQVGVDVPVALYEQFFDPTLPPGTATAQNLTRMGDVRLESKFRLLNDFEHPVGIAVRPYITLPSGAGSKLVGSGSVTGGGDVIFDVHIKDRVFLSWNLGVLARGAATPGNLNVTINDQFRYGMGANVKVRDWFEVLGEIYGYTVLQDFFSNESETPLEALGGLRFFPTEGLRVGVGAGAGLTFGYGAPDFRAILDIAYIKPRVVELAAPPPPPPPPIVQVQERRIVITEKIHFEFDKARIRPISFHILDAVVDVMIRHPEIQKVQIEGYTDAVGSDQYNLRLSQRRAESVRQYLIAHGVAADRLVAKGFGESNPIATNDTALGRARNRRTEFKILQRSAPTTPPAAPAGY